MKNYWNNFGNLQRIVVSAVESHAPEEARRLILKKSRARATFETTRMPILSTDAQNRTFPYTLSATSTTHLHSIIALIAVIVAYTVVIIVVNNIVFNARNIVDIRTEQNVTRFRLGLDLGLKHDEKYSNVSPIIQETAQT